MTLPDLWFLIIAFLWTGFFVLEGFDFGVGMLHKVVGRTDTEQRVAINSIGPFWDGNEVWLIVGAAGDLRRVPQLVRHVVLRDVPARWCCCSSRSSRAASRSSSAAAWRRPGGGRPGRGA